MTSESEKLREQGWGPVVDRLRSEHFVVETVTYVAPVQLVDRLPGGERFYFRARWNTCQFEVSRDSPEPGSHWQKSVELVGDHSASYLEPEEGETIFHRLITAYGERRAGGA